MINKQQVFDSFKNIYKSEEYIFSETLYNQLIELKLDEKSSIIGFLMQADISNDEIRKSILNFLDQDSLKELELLKRISKISVIESQKKIVNLRKQFIDLSEDISVIIIKLAERLVKLRKADENKSDKLASLADECLYFYSPKAQMLGIRKIYQEMEDISFRVLFPEDFAYLQKTLSDNMNMYDSKLNAIKEELSQYLKDHNIDARIQSRIKRP